MLALGARARSIVVMGRERSATREDPKNHFPVWIDNWPTRLGLRLSALGVSSLC